MLFKLQFESLSELDDFVESYGARRPKFEAAETAIAEVETAVNKPEPKPESDLVIHAAEPVQAEPEPAAEETPTTAPVHTVSESDVKLLLTEKIKEGKKAEVKALFHSYGVDKLSELVAQHLDQLDEFYERAGEL